jgi:hypothetical protein
VVDLVHPVRIGERVGGGVADDGTVLPAVLPQRAGHRHVLVGPVVAGVVVEMLAQPVGVGRAQVRGDDVPADPAAGEVVQRAEQPGALVRGVVGGGVGDREAEVLGHRRERRQQQDRVDGRDLHRVPHGRLPGRPVGVVDTVDVGEEQRVDPGRLQPLGDLSPIRHSTVPGRRPVGRIPPQPFELR